MLKTACLHIIPFAHLGGCEKNCLAYIKADVNSIHHILVLDKEGPISKMWTEANAIVTHLNCLDDNKRIVKSIAAYVTIAKTQNFIYWSNLKLPLIRFALKDFHGKLAVHIGNPVYLSILSLIKYRVSDFFYNSNIPTTLFCCSEHVQKSVFSNSYFKKFSTLVIKNPVTLLEKNPYTNRTLDESMPVFLGMTARLDLIKDHKTVIYAFSEILKQFPQAQLWFIGDGDQRNELENLCGILSIKKNVTFWGNITDVYGLLQKLDIFVYSTTLHEGFGNVVAEAMANGLPCIVSDLPMMHEVLQSNDEVYFQAGNKDQLKEKCIKLLLDQDFRQNLSDLNFKNATNIFSSTRFVFEIEKILK